MLARRRLFGMFWLSVFSLALVAAPWLAPRAAANELERLDTSLKLIPADAAYYSSMLRNREQFEAVINSNAWKKIKEMPMVQMGIAMYSMQLSVPDSPPAKLAEMLENPETQKVLDMLGDMASEEIFVYGDTSAADLLELCQGINAAQNFGGLKALATGRTDPLSHRKLTVGEMISSLAEDVDLIGVPNVVFGFRIKNTELAKEQLIKLESIANIMLGSNEKTKGHFKKTKVGDADFLVLELDGEMVPWDEIPLEIFQSMESEEGDVQKIIERIKESKLVVAMGIRDNFLLLSIGSSLDCLKKLGKGPLLVDRPEFKPLAKYADRRITSIGYVSQEMNQRLNNQNLQIDDALKAVERILPETELSDEQQKRLGEDAKSLAGDLKKMLPQVGAVTSINFITDKGIEGYRYAWGGFAGLEGSKPLTLLQHVGGDPILGIVARGKINAKDYDTLSRWVKTAFRYFKEFGLPMMQETERRKLEGVLDGALPLLERFDKANREMLIPSMADGQTALVVDAKLQSRQFVKALPASDEPLPMIEPAIVVGLSDAELFDGAMHEYWKIINGLIDVVRSVEGTDVPENFKLPEPQEEETSLGKVYSFPLPKEWGVDEKIVPSLGISKNVAVFSASRDQTDRMLKATPLAVGGVLSNPDRPLAVAVWFNWAALVEKAKPWIDFAIEQAPAYENVDEAQRQMIIDQVHTVLDVLAVVRTISVESFFDGGALVSHSLVELHDVEQ